MMESQSFLAQQCFISFTFMFFSPSLQRNHPPLAQRRVPSQRNLKNVAEVRVRRAHAHSVLSRFPGQLLPPGLLSQHLCDPEGHSKEGEEQLSSLLPNQTYNAQKWLHTKDFIFCNTSYSKATQPRLGRSIHEIALTWQHPAG